MIKAIIIEDEPRSIKLLKNLLIEYCPEVRIVGEAQTVEEGYQCIVQHHPDVIFLDIELQRESGFDLLNKFVDIQFEIIFTTAFEQYALKAIKACALDYLLKPIDIDELQLAVGKISNATTTPKSNKKIAVFKQNLNESKSGIYQLALPSVDGLTIVPVNEIMYLRSDRQYTIFYLNSGEKLVTSKNLGEYEELLSEYNFFRVHHSSIVNIAEVKKYLRGEGGSVVMSNGEQIEVAKRRKDDFLNNFIRR
ncbi:MAG: response regulator transcription factor [Saprospiraceae bacterium]|jgi:two-component system LytT family response regulator|nr:response regulator transcription factor [Saprospiraceae bacterium]MBK8298651.1 response regulator transcription factor [Saprospiraceae bacterium]